VKRWVPVLVSVAVLLSACGSPGDATSPGDAGSVKDEALGREGRFSFDHLR